MRVAMVVGLLGVVERSDAVFGSVTSKAPTGSVLTFETDDSDCGIHLNAGRCNARMTAVYDHQLWAARKTLDAATKPDAGK